MAYKIFAWKEGTFWRGHRLVTLSQVEIMMKALPGREVFATIQTYDKDSNIVGCPLYFDIDGPLGESQRVARLVVWQLQRMFGVVPYIFFSGNKGFHVILPHTITHERCHDVMLEIVKEHFDHPLIDRRVYRPRAMMRLPGSTASREGYFKIRISLDQLNNMSADEIRNLAKERRVFWTEPPDMSKLDEGTMAECLDSATAKLPKITSATFQERAQDLDQDMTACLRTILCDGVTSGARNQAIHVLARFFKQCGVPKATAISLIMENVSYQEAEAEERGVSKVVNSTYTSTQPQRVGCRAGKDRTLLKSHCDQLCHFNEDNFPWFRRWGT